MIKTLLMPANDVKKLDHDARLMKASNRLAALLCLRAVVSEPMSVEG